MKTEKQLMTFGPRIRQDHLIDNAPEPVELPVEYSRDHSPEPEPELHTNIGEPVIVPPLPLEREIADDHLTTVKLEAKDAQAILDEEKRQVEEEAKAAEEAYFKAVGGGEK